MDCASIPVESRLSDTISLLQARYIEAKRMCLVHQTGSSDPGCQFPQMLKAIKLTPRYMLLNVNALRSRSDQKYREARLYYMMSLVSSPQLLVI